MSSLSYFDMQMLRNEIENYKQAKKLQLEEIQEKNCRISSLEASLKEEQGLVAKMKEESKEMQVLRNEIEKYKQAEKLQLEEIDEKNCKISSLEASLKEEQELVAKMTEETKSQLRSAESQNVDLTNKYEAKIRALHKAIKHLENKCATEKTMRDKKEKEVESLVVLKIKNEQEKQELKMKLSKTTEEKNETLKELQKQNEQLQTEIQNNEKYIHRNDVLERRIDELLTLPGEVYCRQQKVKSVEEEKEKLQAELKKCQRQNEEYKAGKRWAIDEKNQLTKKNDELKVRQREKECNNITLRKELKAKVLESESQIKELARQRFTIDRLENCLEDKTKQIIIFENETQEPGKKISSQKNNIARLKTAQQLKGLYDTLGRTVQVEKKASPEQQRKDGDEQIARKKVRFVLSNAEYFPSKGDNELKEQQKEIRDLKGKTGNKLTTYDSKLKAVHGLLPPISTRARSKTVDNSKKQSESRSSLNLKSTVTPKAEEEMFHPHSPELTSQSTLRRVYNPATKILKRRLSAKPNHI
ncbi:CAP-Gly domain-containing linker protein 1-like [Astatotilapia calliptera]|uniref:CAP-Gly domain-containing linker protein 1-like n=1 Tax=Astatotilapia calliptera TaxID=8154 RepID=UPI000E42C2B2|nr:CAP-Gly domain-containing linker protein 1-like [Astatotilapia calliptera]